MSYKESCGGCPRLPIWSSPNVLVRGDRAGSLNEDNARVIAEQAARITYFRASRRSQLLSSAPVLEKARPVQRINPVEDDWGSSPMNSRRASLDSLDCAHRAQDIGFCGRHREG